MSENKINARIQHHRFNGTGVEPTVPLIDDITSASFSSTDLKKGEIAINLTDEKAWFRSNFGVVELLTTSTFSEPLYSFGNGIKNDDGEITLGGELSEALTIGGGANSFVLGSTGSPLDSFEMNSDNNVSFRVDTGDVVLISDFGTVKIKAPLQHTGVGESTYYNSYSTATTGGSSFGVGLISFSDNQTCNIKAYITGHETATQKTIGGELWSVWKNVGGTVSSVGSPVVNTVSDFSTAGFTYSSGTNLLGFQFNGEGGYNIDWNVRYEYFIL